MCCFTLEENFRDKLEVSEVACSVICHAGIRFHRILPEFKLRVSNLSPKMLWYCHRDPERPLNASAEIHELELNSCVRP